jgi:hypothetical protein
MIPHNPTEDLPSTETECCDIGGCGEPWADTVDAANGPRLLRLCESHHDEWTAAARSMSAEIEEQAGRAGVHAAPLARSMAPFFALAREYDARRRNGRKGAA